MFNDDEHQRKVHADFSAVDGQKQFVHFSLGFCQARYFGHALRNIYRKAPEIGSTDIHRNNVPFLHLMQTVFIGLAGAVARIGVRHSGYVVTARNCRNSGIWVKN